MNKIIKSLFIVLTAMAGTVQASASEKSVGIMGGVSTAQPAPVAGVYFGLGVIPHLRITPSITYQFEVNRQDAITLSLDVQSPWKLTGTRFKVYPLVGVNIGRWNFVNTTADGHSEKHRVDRIGFNVGGGVEWQPSKALGLKIFAEGKYAYVKRFDTGIVSIGLGYVF